MKLQTFDMRWHISGKCFDKCGYCYGHLTDKKKHRQITPTRLTKAQHFEIQEQLKETAAGIRYSGGEPLYIPELPELMADAKNAGIKTSLITTGMTDEKNSVVIDRLISVLNYTDEIAVPFESLDDDLNFEIRKNRDHRINVLYALDLADRKGVKEKSVNTCVHKKNIHKLLELGGTMNQLARMGLVDNWRLRMFYPIAGRGRKNSKEYEISRAEFDHIANILVQMCPNINVQILAQEDFQKYFMISQHADVFRSKGNENIFVGNMLKQDLNLRELAIEQGIL